jgi:hypothetical protein
MVYNFQSYWVSRVCPSPGILSSRKQRFGNWVCFCSEVRGGREVQRLRLALSKGPNRVDVSLLLYSPDLVSKTLCFLVI